MNMLCIFYEVFMRFIIIIYINFKLQRINIKHNYFSIYLWISQVVSSILLQALTFYGL